MEFLIELVSGFVAYTSSVSYPSINAEIRRFIQQNIRLFPALSAAVEKEQIIFIEWPENGSLIRVEVVNLVDALRFSSERQLIWFIETAISATIYFLRVFENRLKPTPSSRPRTITQQTTLTPSNPPPFFSISIWSHMVAMSLHFHSARHEAHSIMHK